MGEDWTVFSLKMWKKKEFGADLLCSARFQILLLQISQQMRMAEGSGEWESAAGFVGEALEYVNVYMTEDISVQDIADALNVSRYLIKKFMLLNREKITFFELAH